uniref:Uncharacterized protein n=1 Tax=Cajanus cajan TaxID=3821 RepID=A0A151QPN5_CAJCA|nr:hypothetical protein KK1_047093 [Cajanus cajan]
MHFFFIILLCEHVIKNLYLCSIIVVVASAIKLSAQINCIPMLNGERQKREKTKKRRNKTLKDLVRSMICHFSLLESLWGEMLKSAVYFLNKVPSKAVNKTRSQGYRFYNPTTRSFFETGNERFLEDVEFRKEEYIRNVIF